MMEFTNLFIIITKIKVSEYCKSFCIPLFGKNLIHLARNYKIFETEN